MARPKMLTKLLQPSESGLHLSYKSRGGREQTDDVDTNREDAKTSGDSGHAVSCFGTNVGVLKRKMPREKLRVLIPQVYAKHATTCGLHSDQSTHVDECYRGQYDFLAPSGCGISKC
jgi:hypothetical protein